MGKYLLEKYLLLEENNLNIESKEETCKTCHYSRPHPNIFLVGALRCHRQVPPWSNVEETDWCGVWAERWVPYDD
jgi:hypothetical protein